MRPQEGLLSCAYGCMVFNDSAPCVSHFLLCRVAVRSSRVSVCCISVSLSLILPLLLVSLCRVSVSLYISDFSLSSLVVCLSVCVCAQSCTDKQFMTNVLAGRQLAEQLEKIQQHRAKLKAALDSRNIGKIEARQREWQEARENREVRDPQRDRK